MTSDLLAETLRIFQPDVDNAIVIAPGVEITLELPSSISEMSIADPDIASAKIVTTSKLSITGRKTGTTSLFTLGNKGIPLHYPSIVVSPSADVHQAGEVITLSPRSYFDAFSANRKLVDFSIDPIKGDFRKFESKISGTIEIPVGSAVMMETDQPYRVANVKVNGKFDNGEEYLALAVVSERIVYMIGNKVGEVSLLLFRNDGGNEKLSEITTYQISIVPMSIPQE